MPNVHLTQSRVNALRPRKRPFELRDSTLRGFGVRVMPSGAKCYFIHSQHDGRRIWRVVGLAPAMDFDEARVHARAMLGALRCGKVAPTRPANTAFESVAEEVFRRYTRHWKSATLTVNRQYLRKQILPYFKGRPISEITVEEVRHWFDALHLTPMAANRSLPILSVIRREAEVYGYRPEESDPCRGIQRYRSRGRERFLSREEFARIGAVLRRLEGTRPLQVGAIALLLHTGCRRSEITTLQWHHVREGKLFLPDSKTGPRTVWLSRAAYGILHRLPRKKRWIFPSARRPGTPISAHTLYEFWTRVREEAGVPNVRLHDLRHTYATFALRQGESVLAIGRLLGHVNPLTTLKYTHLADAMVREAAETVGAILGG